MELALIVYLIGIIPSIESFFSGLSFISVVLFLFGMIFFPIIMESSPFDFAVQHKWFSGSVIGMFFLSSLAVVVIPEEKTMYMMAGAYATQQVYQSDEAKRIGNKVVNLLEIKIDEYAKDAEQSIKNGVDAASNK